MYDPGDSLVGELDALLDALKQLGDSLGLQLVSLVSRQRAVAEVLLKAVLLQGVSAMAIRLYDEVNKQR